MKATVKILPDTDQLYLEAAHEFARLSQESVKSNGVFNVAFSGGHTPRGLYLLLADKSQPFRDEVPWQRTHVFWGDERCVPPTDPESNYRMVWDALLSKVPVSPGNIHRMPAEAKDSEAAAEGYERLIRLHFRLNPGELPRFDLILLGMGADGHTASLFPDSQSLKEAKKLVCAAWDAKMGIHRVTFTYPVLDHAANIRFLVSGMDKAETVRLALEDGPGSQNLPVAGVRPVDGNVMWLLDAAAAGRLSPDQNRFTLAR